MEPENNDVEKDEVKPTPPPYYRPRSRQLSRVIPELKTPELGMSFFKTNTPVQLGLSAGTCGAVITGIAYAIYPVASGLLLAIPPALIGGLITASIAGGGKFAWEEYEKCKKNSASRRPTP